MRQFSPQSIGTLDDLAFRVAAEGVDAHRSAVSQVVRGAARHGAPSVLTDLVIDPREPSVARVRAFGELLVFLGRDRRSDEALAADRSQPDTQPERRDIAWHAHAA
jgi:hypothetical protein